jgi:HK97 family phage prohead protease
MNKEKRVKTNITGVTRMIIRTKSGSFRADNTSVLLEYLGITKNAVGVQRVAAEVELVASVPFQIKNEKGKIKNEEENQDVYEWTFSTFDLDRYGERIDPLGWDFSQYVKNPVIQWAHCFHIPAIGRAENIRVDEKGLHGSLIFNDKAYDQFGWSIGERVKHGIICAGSVGFRVIEIEIPSAADSKDGTSLIFRKQELLEFSVCNVPANPFAMVKDIIRGNMEAASGEEEVLLMNNEQGTSGKIAENNEEREMGNGQGIIATPFWGGLINNF